MTLFGNRVFADVRKGRMEVKGRMEMRSYWIRVDPIQGACPYVRQRRTARDTGGKPFKPGGRDYNYAATSQ